MAHVEPYRLKDGARRYRARWQGPDGRDRSRTFPLKRDAERFVLELHRQAALGGLYQAPTQPLGAFLDGWLVRYERRVRQSSADRARDVLPHLGPFRHTTLDALRPAEVEDHISALSARAPRQAELALRVLKQVLSDAKLRGLTVNEALFRIRAPHHEPREMRFLSWSEVDLLADQHHRALRQPGAAGSAHRTAPGRAVRAARPQRRSGSTDADRRGRRLRRPTGAGQDPRRTPPRRPRRSRDQRPARPARRAPTEPVGTGVPLAARARS